jgi:hypothetical protein
MKETPRRNHVIDIPIHWTPAQADAVFDFLALLETAIFDAYDKELTEIAQLDLLASRIHDSNTNDEDADDDIPF